MAVGFAIPQEVKKGFEIGQLSDVFDNCRVENPCLCVD